MRKIYIFAILSIIPLIAGCVPYNVKVDSISSPERSLTKKYILLPGDKTIDENDLEFKEYAKYVRRALDNKGFIAASAPDEAGQVIFLNYGIGNPQQSTSTVVVPKWGQTGVASSNTFGTVNSYGNTATYSSTTTYNPTYGVTGYVPVTKTETLYSRYVLMESWDVQVFRETKQKSVLWKTTVTSTGSSGDLRKVMPVMVGAASQFLGENTHGQEKIRLTDSDERVTVLMDSQSNTQ